MPHDDDPWRVDANSSNWKLNPDDPFICILYDHLLTEFKELDPILSGDVIQLTVAFNPINNADDSLPGNTRYSRQLLLYVYPEITKLNLDVVNHPGYPTRHRHKADIITYEDPQYYKRLTDAIAEIRQPWTPPALPAKETAE